MKPLHKLLWVALVLLVVAVVVNLTDPTHSLSRLMKGDYGQPKPVEPQFGPPKPLPPVGSESAKVRLTVYVQSGNQCHDPTITFCQKLGEALPSRIRVVFVDTMTQAGAAQKQKQAIQCEASVLINGQTRFEIERDGKKVTVNTGGPIGMEVVPREFLAALRQVLAKEYGKAITKEELDRIEALDGARPTPAAGAAPSPKQEKKP